MANNHCELDFDLSEVIVTGNKDYEKLKNKPSINGHELVGDQTTEDLGIPTGDMEKSVYDTNDNGIVDKTEQVMFGETPVSFGIDSSGNYGYIKDGDEDVTPFNQGGGGGAGVSTVTFNGQKHTPDAEGNVSIEEADPTVPGWAKSETKPSYTANEVKAVDVDDTFTLEELDNMFATVFGE